MGGYLLLSKVRFEPVRKKHNVLLLACPAVALAGPALQLRFDPQGRSLERRCPPPRGRRGTVSDWRIDDLAQRAGVAVDTIRYYQREGLLRSGERDGRTESIRESLTLHLWLREELASLLGAAGFREVSFQDFRDFREPATARSWRLWLCARRA